MSKKKEPKPGELRHTNEEVIKALADWRTVEQLSTSLNVTKPTIRTYLGKLGKLRKIETKLFRQGTRGPQAVAFRIRVR